jgi:hypothetical protein
MRLAKPSLNGEELTLTFKFAFHKKRVEDLKALSLISEIVSNHLNISPIINPVVDSNMQQQAPANVPVAAPKDDASASLIASVQDIMGGGEIVDAQDA